MLDQAAIQDKLSRAALDMSRKTPELLGLYVTLEKKMTSDTSITMRVGCRDGKPFLVYGDWFVNMLEPTLLGMVLHMNCLRIALHHCDKRVRQPEALYRLASDLVVREYSQSIADVDAGDNSAILSQVMPSIWAYSGVFDKFDFDPARDLTLEKVFDMLCQADVESENETDRESEKGPENGDGEGTGDPGSDTGEGGPDDADRPGGDSDPWDDDADGDEGGEGDNPFGESLDEGNGHGETAEPSPSYTAMQQMFSPETAAADLAEWGRDDEASAEIRNAIPMQSTGGYAGTPGRVQLAIRTANRVRVDAARVFRMFISSNFSPSFTASWSMPNLMLRRFGPIAPGHVRKRDRPHILFAIDVSMSMVVEGLIEQCISAVGGFIGKSKMDLCSWDGECSEIARDVKDIDTSRLYGGGCTDPQCVLKRVEREHLSYDGMVFLTDCEFDWPAPLHPERICIIRTRGSSGMIPAWCKWKMEMDDLLLAV